jgi:hypothetical protein
MNPSNQNNNTPKNNTSEAFKNQQTQLLLNQLKLLQATSSNVNQNSLQSAAQALLPLLHSTSSLSANSLLQLNTNPSSINYRPNPIHPINTTQNSVNVKHPSPHSYTQPPTYKKPKWSTNQQKRKSISTKSPIQTAPSHSLPRVLPFEIPHHNEINKRYVFLIQGIN